MHFVIVGSGAVGGYFGARLAQSGQEVSFIARGEHLSVMQQQGLVIESLNGDFVVKSITAVEHSAQLAIADVILLAVKSFQLIDAIKLIEPVIRSTTRIIPLLNGVNAAQLLIDNGIGSQQVYGGLAKIISQLKSPGVIAHTGAEPHITLGLLPQNDTVTARHNEQQRMEDIVQCFKQAKVSVGVAKDINLALWRKFIFVAAWGALASCLRLPVGQLRQGEQRDKLLAIINEYATIAQYLGVAITDALILQTVKFIDALPAQSETSMQRDLENGLQSEFDTLVAYPYQLAMQHQLTTPVLKQCYQQLTSKNYNK
ncbi:2-dehydropantoate 2-reductase [Thalassotalea insulae]|uniref:2-dehydropantoate 2-reductase n=1 Tax=Thalassotalea insulae TaxID=2056778 RepID=A0ABQ6GW34_9GAMM|nr:2-dehydropantoate 2-reductase [Thalassotalea insulae]GLX80115.1 2-dehydropantoate 2-reductase [Thalassotalea insulae]